MIGEIIDLISIAQYWYLSILRYFVSVIELLRIYLMTDADNGFDMKCAT